MEALFGSIDLRTFGIALISGIVPALIWLWFWLKEDADHPEPVGLLALTFIVGMLMVIVVLPIQQLVQEMFSDQKLLIILWAGIEEIIKFGGIYLIALRSKAIDEPIDLAVYMITGALGFAALENAFFLIEPIAIKEATVSFLTGNLRFLGATLLHAISSGVIGIFLGLSYYQGWFAKKLFLLMGITASIALHSVFNFLIIKNGDQNALKTFVFLWAMALLTMLLFEKLRQLSHYHLNRREHQI
jgi:RsiW-degrading membrane proteinase PrsW (M82 family)